MVLEAGANMPRVQVSDDSGETLDTGEFLGKTLVLWFYPKDATPG